METRQKIEQFLEGKAFAVVGASSDRAKYGNKVLRAYIQHGLTVFPVNPNEDTVEGLKCYPDLASLPGPVHGVSIITPPPVTRKILEQAAAAGIQHVWMQPGAEPADFGQRAEELGLVAIGDGPCVLVTLGFREE